MTADARSCPSLRDVVAVHEAAAALGQPSTIYRAGGMLTAQQWLGHTTATSRSGPRGYACRLYRQTITLQQTAAIYGLAGQIIEIRAVTP